MQIAFPMLLLRIFVRNPLLQIWCEEKNREKLELYVKKSANFT